MTVELTTLTPPQQQAVESNFSRAGTFFLSDDLHSMLDCASTWDVDIKLRSGANAAALPPGVVGFASDGILREEFFGGIYFDRRAHRQAMVDAVGYAVLRTLAASQATPMAVIAKLAVRFGADAVSGALSDLLAARVIATGATNASPRIVPADDLSKPYLQVPTIVEAELTYGCFRACRHCAYSSSPQARTDDELGVPEWRPSSTSSQPRVCSSSSSPVEIRSSGRTRSR